MPYYPTIIKPAEHTDIYWPKAKESTFTLRYCIIVDGGVVPVYKNFHTYQGALDYIPTARAEQGFATEEGV